MHNVVVIWPETTDYLVNEIALLEGAKWNRRFFNEKVDVLVIGEWSVVEPIIDEVGQFNYQFHDCQSILRRLEVRFASLLQRYPRFHFNAFMRWLVIDEYLRSNSYVAMDGDLVLSSDVLRDPHLLTQCFTVDSTCFVAINDDQWLKGYREAVALLNDDPDKFQREWDASLDVTILEPKDPFEINEESFVRFLIKTGRIPNSFPVNSPYWFTPRHIQLGSHELPFQKIRSPVKYERTDKGELLNGTPLAFIHFQWRFKEYLSSYFMMRHIFQVDRLQRVEPAFFLGDGISARPDLLQMQQKARDFICLGNLVPDVSNIFSRKFVMIEFLFKNDFSCIFNDRHWHTPGYFQGA